MKTEIPIFNMQPIHRNSTLMAKIIASVSRSGSFSFEGRRMRPIDARKEGLHIHLKCEILY